MSESELAQFQVARMADVTVAARKARVLAALADVEKKRRSRLSRAVTETCRSLLSLGGTAVVWFGVVHESAQWWLQVRILWQDAAPGRPGVVARRADRSTPATTRPAGPRTRTTREIAVRRVGELLDAFSLNEWPGPGAVAVLRMRAPADFEFVETDAIDWSSLLNESLIEEVVRRGERRRKLLVADLKTSRLQDGLLEETAGEAGETALVSMLSLVASQTDNGVAILDNQARFAWVNSAFAAQWGYDLDACSGQPIDKLIQHEETDESSMNRVRTTLRTGSSDYVELLARQRDGTGRWTGLSLTPALDEADRVQRWIVLLRDVTQQKEARDMLAAARDSAEQANRSKSEFLANMSHEIRTPMNAVIGMTELALGTDLTPEQHEYLSTVRMSAEALLELLNDILDLSKIEAGKVELDEVDFDLAEVVRDSLKALAVKAHGKGLELATRLPMDLPHYLHGDPLRLRQVLINLVGNAIKFTDCGEVVVEFERTIPKVDDESIELKFVVRDTGIGIPPDQLGQIFEAFTQVDTSTTRQFGGTGLGLTITAELLRIMGGHVRVESQTGVGSSFHVMVPFGLAEESSVPFSGRIEFSREQLEGRTVLVVDDNATNRRILEELLTSWGLRPRMAANAESAMKELETAAYYGRPFDLLLIDAMMPGTDGFLMMEQIRRRNDFRVDAVMMLSSADRADSARRCRALGIGAYLVKPVSQSSLLDSILDALSDDSSQFESRRTASRSQLESTAKSAREMLPAPQQEKALVSLRVLIADDHDANRRLAEKILEKRGHRSVHAATGREVLEALRNDSFDLILMDVQMPELDGFQATTKIREIESSGKSRIPIVALTAHAMKGDREKCLAAGMDAYLSKPLRARELIALVEKLCGPVAAARVGASSSGVETGRSSGADHSREGRNSDTVSDSAPVDSTPVCFRGALDRMDGDVELLIEQMRFFLDDAPRLLAQVSKAADSRDGNMLRSSAHRLKGLVSTYDQLQATELCSRLEFAGRDDAFHDVAGLAAQLGSYVSGLLAAIRLYVADHGDE